MCVCGGWCVCAYMEKIFEKNIRNCEQCLPLGKGTEYLGVIVPLFIIIPFIQPGFILLHEFFFFNTKVF